MHPYAFAVTLNRPSAMPHSGWPQPERAADDPDTVLRQAVAAGATALADVAEEHGWCLGRILGPFGHEWEIGTPLGAWAP